MIQIFPGVTAKGILFEPQRLSRELQRAIDKTIAYGVDVAGSVTPVRTGNLKSRWDSDDDTIFNDTYYAGYVDDGTSRFSGRRMTTRSLRPVTDEFISNILEVLD